MTQRALPFRTVPLALAALALAACAPRGAVSTAPTPSPAPRAAPSAANPADTRFMTMMIAHHAQAIEVSRLAPDRAGSPSIRTLAARIINAQRDEIAIMQRWLRDHGVEAPHVDEAGAVHATPAAGQPASQAHGAHGAHGAEHSHATMPGMLTPAQLAELKQAKGREFDRLFLVNMIRHHKGAVAMVQQLIDSPGAAQDDTVFKLAHDVNVDQVTEIDRMEKMLAELLFGVPASP